MPRIRLVTFDALYTLIKPRRPIHVQYAEVFEQHLPGCGRVDADAVKRSFKLALREVQRERPVYRLRGEQADAESWWREVIWRTGVGAGVDEHALDRSLGEIVTRLMKRFSSKEGYEAYGDAVSTLQELRKRGVYVGVITNGDGRVREVLKDLEFPEEMFRVDSVGGKDLVVISEEEGVAKPDERIFEIALERVNERYGVGITASECVHVGDELESDYEGAVRAGWRGLLVGSSLYASLRCLRYA